MNQFGEVAIRALEIYAEKKNDPRESWIEASNEIIGKDSSSSKKVCPRSTFLGLCEEGYIKNIPKGIYLRNRQKNGNKKYAIYAVKILFKDPAMKNNTHSLWKKAIGNKEIRENGQMDVVIALFEKKYIIQFK
jgi:hypothetical protein